MTSRGHDFDTLVANIKACALCSERFAASASAHMPRPVTWFERSARILIAGQAPGARVHKSGRPFTDPSGDRLRRWLGIDEATFYDTSRIAIVPMAFCFPGYDARGSDLAPPKLCKDTWHEAVLSNLPDITLTILVGAYAQKYHLSTTKSLTQTVRDWSSYAPRVFPLPHPSWRNTGWVNKHPWFEADLLPALRQRVQELL